MNINENFAYQGAVYSTAQASPQLSRHRWYVIKESFSPRLVEAAIDSVGLKKDDAILDPFCGCGTVPLTSAEKGYESVGIEVNPFLAFVSATKVSRCDVSQFQVEIDRVSKYLENSRFPTSALEGFSTFSKTNLRDKWL